MPDLLFDQADAEAKKLGVSRSRLIQIALERYLGELHDTEVTEAINRAIERDGGLDPEDEIWLEHGRKMLYEALKDDEWEK